jgi:hypothetical protein
MPLCGPDEAMGGKGGNPMATTPSEGRPEEIAGVNLEEAFAFLDALRESGQVNMFGARPSLQKEFSCSRHAARKVLSAWMQDYGREK